MHLRHDRATILALGFVALSVGSIIYLSILTANYLLYYPALATIYFTASDPSLTHDPSTNRTIIITSVTVTNPSGYSGFRLSSATASMFFYDALNTSSTLFYMGKVSGYMGLGNPLPARSTILLDVPIKLSSDQSISLEQFVAVHSGHVNATALIRVEVSSFLNPAIGHYIYESPENFTLA